jgi:DNA-directed RNA polymerase specialized sigma24 family protein
VEFPDHELEDCQRRLVKMFLARGARDKSEDLASEAILRVVCNARSGETIANLRAYALGVGRLVLQEFWRGEGNPERRADTDVSQLKMAAPEPDPVAERRHICLERCLGELSLSQRALLSAWYWGGRGGADLASRLDITARAVLIRLHRIRKSLKRCVERRMKEMETR